ncbi:hypothetical protein [Streptomyces celluloflavus]|uniref:hypothetical protein n=1 Tax=Streptomyces celluloflavus TaxID=58344 RepID=UPI00365EAE73
MVSAGLAQRLLVTSRTQSQAQALADDLADLAASTNSPTTVTAAALPDLLDCQAVVIAVRARFTNTASRNVRMGGAAANAPVVRILAAALRGHSGTVIMVTQPCRPSDQTVRRVLRLHVRVRHRLAPRHGPLPSHSRPPSERAEGGRAGTRHR